MKMAWVLLDSTLLMMCSAMTIGHDDLEEEDTSADGSLPGDPMLFGKCKICKFVLEEVKQSASPSNVEKLTQKLHRICDKIPLGIGKRICREYVHKYFLKLVDELAADDAVETICVNVKMCTKKELLDLSY